MTQSYDVAEFPKRPYCLTTRSELWTLH